MKRYLAAYDRLINIKDRVTAHIEKIEEKGQDATAAKAELDKATPLLAKALASIDELKASLTATANNPTDETLKKTSQDKAELAKAALKEAHAALIKVIETLKPAKPSGNATSSSKTI
jgi:F0F1-type ATP synthase membrane subunit b/b'